MIIRSDPKWKKYYLFLTICGLFGCFVFMREKAYIMAYLIAFLIGIEVILGVIVMSYTLIMDEKGCTVLWGKYKRTYEWEKFSIIRLEKNILTQGYSECVLFSVYPIKKAKIRDPISYCQYRHPFTCFAVFFIPPEAKRMNLKIFEVYEIEKEEFLSKMKEWGVQISGI